MDQRNFVPPQINSQVQPPARIVVHEEARLTPGFPLSLLDKLFQQTSVLYVLAQKYHLWETAFTLQSGSWEIRGNPGIAALFRGDPDCLNLPLQNPAPPSRIPSCLGGQEVAVVVPILSDGRTLHHSREGRAHACLD